MGKYDKITNDEFCDILGDILQEEGRNLLSVPGVYEIVSETFNNEVLRIWEEKQSDDDLIDNIRKNHGWGGK